MIFHGRCWKFGDNIPTDQIVKSQYIFESLDVMARHVLEDQDPEFPLNVSPGDVMVAGYHFGQSSGRAIAAKAIKATGVACVVAETFARTFYRNSFEVGLPVLEVGGISTFVEGGEEIVVDVTAGRVTLPSSGRELRGEPTHPFLLDMVEAGGLIPYVQRGDLDLT